MPILCCCPPLRPTPPSPMGVFSPSGKSWINSCAHASVAAFSTSGLLMSDNSTPNAMFSATVPGNRFTVWGTMATALLMDSLDRLFKF
eukprot:scaffold3852_cov402-Prasinococcus_capsulatus_cf.AAC.14